MSKTDNLLVLGGCLGLICTPLIIFALMFPMAGMAAWVWMLAYDMLLVPGLATYGLALPAVGFWYWLCAFVLVGAIRFPLTKPSEKELTSKEIFNAYFSRFWTGLCFAFCIWLLNLIVF